MLLEQPLAEESFHEGAEADLGQAEKSPRQLGVEQPIGYQAGLDETGQVLGCGVQDPFLGPDDLLQGLEVPGAISVAERDGVDEMAARPGAAQLDQIGTPGVAEALGPFGVDRDRPFAGGKVADGVRERRRVGHQSRQSVARARQHRQVVVIRGFDVGLGHVSGPLG